MITADIVLRNGAIMTFAGAKPRARVIAIGGSRILALDADAEASIGSGTQVLDLGGRTVIPGLFDSHIHTVMGGRNELAVSLGNAKSIADVQAAFAERAKTVSRGSWILGGSGWHESQLREGRLPVRQELDAVTPDNPVLLRRGGHVVVVNSAALALAGVTKETKDPPGGVIVRDTQTGEPTGALIEPAAFNLVLSRVPQPSRAEYVAGLKQFNAKLNSRGVTSTLEPGLSLDEIAAYMELWRQKAMTTRVRILQKVNGIEDVTALSSVLAPEFGDEWLRIGGFKYMADGGVEAAYMREPYRIVEGEQNDPNFVGKLMEPAGGVDELREILSVAAERGWQMQVHVVGDAAIDSMLDLMEGVAAKHPIGEMRWTLMHVFLPTAAALVRMKKLGLRATVQDHPVKLGHNMIRYWGEERAARSIPVRSILAAGIPSGGGTDAPVVDWNPFESLWWMTTRKIYAHGEIRVLGAAEAIGREEALRLYTMGSAETCFMEKDVGSLEPGKLADLAVLSDDPLAVPDDALRDLRSELTLVGGRIVHRDGL
jgi:predicted amidohydrolase YtcJ